MKDEYMHKFKEETKWEGNAESLANHVKLWMHLKQIGDPSFEPNERLVRDYVARGILSKPSRKGKEAIFGFKQLAQFLACRALIEDGWPLNKIAEDFEVSSIEEIIKLIPGEEIKNEALSLIENFKEDKMNSMNRLLSSREELIEPEVPSFLKRQKQSYSSKSEIKEVLNRIGSDFSNVIKEDFTAYQLATWLLLFIDLEKAKNITREEAEDIGRGIAAALLNQSSLTKADRSLYTDKMSKISHLESQLKETQLELAYHQKQNEDLKIKIFRSEELLAKMNNQLSNFKSSKFKPDK